MPEAARTVKAEDPVSQLRANLKYFFKFGRNIFVKCSRLMKMMRFFNNLTGSLSVESASMLLAGTTIGGSLLGIVRFKLINGTFNNFSTGPFWVAFTVPDFMHYAFVTGLMTFALIPIFIERREANKLQEGWDILSTAINCLMVVMFTFSLLIIIFPHPVAQLLAKGFSPEGIDLTAHIMRLVAINPLLFSVGAIFSCVQQAYRRFFFIAFAPLFYNLSIIASIYIFKDSFAVVGLAVGVAIGAMANLAFIALGLRDLKFNYKPVFKIRSKHFRRLIRLGLGYMISMTFVATYRIVLMQRATFIPFHAVSNITNAFALLTIFETIAVAYGQASLPILAKEAVKEKLTRFRQEFRNIISMTLWLTIPAVMIGYFGRNYITNLVFLS